MSHVAASQKRETNSDIGALTNGEATVKTALDTLEVAVKSGALSQEQIAQLGALHDTTRNKLNSPSVASEAPPLPKNIDPVESAPHSASFGTFRNMSGVDARNFAKEAHGDQKYGDRPYLYHLEKVASLATRFAPEDMKPHAEIVAWLHDVLEDTEISYDALIATFGPKIAQAVRELSGTSEESKDKEFARLKNASLLAKFVKACDLTANMAACVEDLNDKYLKGYADNLHRYQEALGAALSGELLDSCNRASQASLLGIKDQVHRTSRLTAPDGMAIYYTSGTKSWNMEVGIKDGLVITGSGFEPAPCKTYEKQDW